MTACDSLTELPKFAWSYFRILSKNTYRLIIILISLSKTVMVFCSILVTSISVQSVMGMESKYKLLIIFVFNVFFIRLIVRLPHSITAKDLHTLRLEMVCMYCLSDCSVFCITIIESGLLTNGQYHDFLQFCIIIWTPLQIHCKIIYSSSHKIHVQFTFNIATHLNEIKTGFKLKIRTLFEYIMNDMRNIGILLRKYMGKLYDKDYYIKCTQ